MNSFEFLEKLGFSSNEAKVYGTLIKHKVLTATKSPNCPALRVRWFMKSSIV